MRTTLDLSDELIKKVKVATGIKNKTKLIHIALNEYLRKIKRINIKNNYGKIIIDRDVLKMREM